MVPWLRNTEDEQGRVFPQGLRFDYPAQQEQYIQWWCANRASVPADELRVRWYPGSYKPLLNSIIQVRTRRHAGTAPTAAPRLRSHRAPPAPQACDDLTALVPEEERDVVILEEPEHLNW